MITSNLIRNTVTELYRKAVFEIREEVLDALKEMEKNEETDAAKFSAKTIVECIRWARENNEVICGDTGLLVYHVKLGSEVRAPQDLTEAIQAGSEDAIKKIPMRHPCTRPVNPITQEEVVTPVIHYDFLPGKEYIEIMAFPKGTGSSPYSNADVISADLSVIKKYILDMVRMAGPRACPPYTVGVGIGGVLETATLLAAKGVSRSIKERNPDPEVAKVEEELLEIINSFGYGPMGVGGKTTALAVNIEVGNSCGAPNTPGFGWIPVAVIINCYPSRWAKARIYENGRVEYL